MGLYRTKQDRIIDIVKANTSTAIRFVSCGHNQYRLVALSPYERSTAEEDRAGAVVRLAIDKAMEHA